MNLRRAIRVLAIGNNVDPGVNSRAYIVMNMRAVGIVCILIIQIPGALIARLMRGASYAKANNPVRVIRERIRIAIAVVEALRDKQAMLNHRIQVLVPEIGGDQREGNLPSGRSSLKTCPLSNLSTLNPN